MSEPEQNEMNRCKCHAPRTQSYTCSYRVYTGLHMDLGSGRQGRDPAGESPAVPLARFRDVVMPRSALHTCPASRVAKNRRG